MLAQGLAVRVRPLFAASVPLRVKAPTIFVVIIYLASSRGYLLSLRYVQGFSSFSGFQGLMLFPRTSLTIFLVVAFALLTAVGLWMLDGVFAADGFGGAEGGANIFVPFLGVSMVLLAVVVAWAVWPLLRTSGTSAQAGAGQPGAVLPPPAVFSAGEMPDVSQVELPVSEYALETYKAAVDHAPAAIMITNNRGRIEYVNAAFLKTSGYSRNEILGRSPAMFGAGHTRSEVYADLWQTILSGSVWRGEVCNRRKSGEEYWENMAISPLRDRFGRVSHFVAVREDITERKGREEDLRQLAQVDVLTGIANRRYLIDRAEQERRRAERFGQPLALLMVDIDHFKAINDEHGHAVGDQVIRMVAQTCAGSVREIDIVGRYGGEEFVIVLPGTLPEGARELADRLRQQIAAIGVAGADGAPVAVTVSIGFADFEPGDDLEQLLAAADAALYRAKSLGRNCVVAVTDCLRKGPPGDVQ
ncbi:diguanylate cyclase [Aromatoleum toluclasticum]|uniref:sensor domain-containing diguanylate cyclase n=1 Tax=Aromatoleum toluclasticum TaxID=92003 RepID=UPI001D188CE5|nr:diguanylate cyclase [Aromatoleum toluclasticum]MCC4116590.1 diguanylate cyclase [Aromatoleum toluclasticum]